ncbi:MAG TPA: TolC family protein [Steroidobacteraceae bacterium]|nr:TolC family protein [Steroidobacteraceae bacterium]
MPVSCSRRASRTRHVRLCAFVFCAAAGLANAQSLTLNQAVSRTLERNPELAVLAIESEAQSGVLQQAGARPPIEAGLLAENVAGSGAYSSVDSAETTLSIGFLLERGARDRRIEVARAGSDLLAADARIKRIDLAAETAQRFVTVLEHQQALTDSTSATQLAEQSLAAVHTRVVAAKVPKAEEARAQATLARARLAQEHAEHELATARHRLAAMWGSTEPEFSNVQGDLFNTPSPQPFESFRAGLEQNPEIERLLSEKRVREAEARLAELRARLPWHVSAGVRRFEATSDHAFVVGVTVPIASGDLARGATAEARARSRLVDAKGAAMRVRLDAELFALYQEYRHAHTEVSILRNEVLPRIEEALEQSQYAYERGRYGYGEWVAAQRELLDVRRALVEATAKLHQYRIELERLTGTAVRAAQP